MNVTLVARIASARLSKLVSVCLLATVPILPASAYADSTVHSQVEIRSPLASGAEATAKLTADAVGDQHLLSGSVSTPAGSADFSFDGKTLTLGDGYGISTDILKNDGTEFVINLTAFSPGSDGPRSRRQLTTDPGVGGGPNLSPAEDTTVTVRYNKITGRASEGDVARLNRFLSASTQFGLLAVALPTLAKQVASPGKVANSILGCIGMIFAYIASMIAFVAGCGVPEPLEPFACAGAVIAFIGAGVALVDSCAV